MDLKQGEGGQADRANGYDTGPARGLLPASTILLC